MRANKYTQNSGFTLVEVSLVVVIIGMLVGGIVLSRSLIQGANMQSVIADFDKHRKSFDLYKTKYGELAGDHIAASALSSLDTGCTERTASDTYAAATCNGNGDGIIGDATAANCNITNMGETLMVWQHLTLAGYTSGKYTGRISTATNRRSTEINVPGSKIKNGAFMVANHMPGKTGCDSFAFKSGPAFYFGSFTSTTLPAVGPVLKPEDAKSIDQKMDDGSPARGSVITLKASEQANCATTSDQTAVYSDNANTTCSLIFQMSN